MFERINEQIEVLVNFTLAHPVPLLFTWNKKKFKIAQINFVHTSHEGKALLVHYAVSTQKESFNITFNTRDLVWILEEIYMEGFRIDKSLNAPNYAKNYNAH